MKAMKPAKIFFFEKLSNAGEASGPKMIAVIAKEPATKPISGSN